MNNNIDVVVVGAGLAGCEAAWQLAEHGFKVALYEMKKNKKSPAHKSDDFAELVCSNSLRSNELSNAVGLLKEEMRRFNSLIIKCADENAVPAGGALAVDRDKFSLAVSTAIKNHKNIIIYDEEYTSIDFNKHTIIAAGPLCSQALVDSIKKLDGLNTLSFYDAAAPIVSAESLDFDKIFEASRWDKGSDYLNCPMEKEEYFEFYNALINAETAKVHGFEEKSVFEGCMPIESMAKRGEHTMRFGPLKPKGLKNPKTGRTPYAVVQLRAENKAKTMYNIVGFQTKLKFPEQKRVFSLIPGLENAEFERFGVMHRNTFLNSPGFLDNTYTVISNSNLSFAGQITGVEGYVESAASGLHAALNKISLLKTNKKFILPIQTAFGALANYISTENKHFQPMNCTFGIMDISEFSGIRDKKERYNKASQKALGIIEEIKNNLDF